MLAGSCFNWLYLYCVSWWIFEKTFEHLFIYSYILWNTCDLSQSVFGQRNTPCIFLNIFVWLCPLPRCPKWFPPCPLATSLTAPHLPLTLWAQCATLSSAPSAGGSGLSGKRRGSHSGGALCDEKESSGVDAFGGELERTGNRGLEPFFEFRLWAQVGRHGGALCSLGAPTVPTSDILISPGKTDLPLLGHLRHFLCFYLVWLNVSCFCYNPVLLYGPKCCYNASSWRWHRWCLWLYTCVLSKIRTRCLFSTF